MATKKLICDRVRFANLNMIHSISGDTVNFHSGYSWTEITTRRGELSEELSQSAPGQSVNQILTFAAKLEADTLNLLRKPSIYILNLTDGREIIWGTMDKPIRSTKFSDKLGATSAEIYRKSLRFEFA